MEDDPRSNSYGRNSNVQIEASSQGGPHHFYRSYSTPQTQPQTQVEIPKKDMKLKKGKSAKASSSSSVWSLGDPELQRKKRVASYKVYTVEGQLKGSLRKSFRWVKDRYAQVVYGWK